MSLHGNKTGCDCSFTLTFGRTAAVYSSVFLIWCEWVLCAALMRVVCLFMSLTQRVNSEQRSFLSMRVNYSNYSRLIITHNHAQTLWSVGKLSRWSSALLCLILATPVASAWQTQVLITTVNLCALTHEDSNICLELVLVYLTTHFHEPLLLSVRVQHSRTLIRLWHLITLEGKVIFSSHRITFVSHECFQRYIYCSNTIIFHFTDID